MWIPASAAEVEQAAARGDLQETPTFDAKRELPAPGKNVHLAVDIAAMSTAGGVLLYGLGEDEHGRLTQLAPFDLTGQRERVDTIRQTAISEPPDVDIRTLPCDDAPERGYLVVVVPTSPRAPHMVTSGGKNRFYGRGETGNRLLTEADIAALYAQRQRWDRDAGALLDVAMKDAPIETKRQHAFLHLVLQPLTAPVDLLERASGETDTFRWLFETLHGVTGSDVWQVRGSQSFHIFNSQNPTPDGWEFTSGMQGVDPFDPKYVRRLLFRDDGGLVAFEGDMGRRRRDSDGGQMAVWDDKIAEFVTRYCALAERILNTGGYVGQVDAAVALTNVADASPAVIQYGNDSGRSHRQAEYRRTARVQATALADPVAVARLLVQPFIRSVTNRDVFELRLP